MIKMDISNKRTAMIVARALLYFIYGNIDWPIHSGGDLND